MPALFIPGVAFVAGFWARDQFADVSIFKIGAVTAAGVGGFMLAKKAKLF